MDRSDSHKRSKSQIAKSLLQRATSRQDIHDNNSSANLGPPSSSASPSTSVTSLNSSSLAPSSASQAKPIPSRHRPHLSTTMSHSLGRDEPGSISASSQSLAQPSTSPTAKAASLEQSVKMFRIFEALRSGDTNAVTRALQESQNTSGDSTVNEAPGKLEGTSVLHLAVQCAEMPVIEFLLAGADPTTKAVDINERDKEGNTPLHIAASLGRTTVVRKLLDQPGVDDTTTNYQGQTALDLSRTPEIHQQLQLSRSIFIDTNVKKVQSSVASKDYDGLEKLLTDPRVGNTLDINGPEFATEATTVANGGTLLHEAARNKDSKLIQLLLLNGADPFRRDRKGKLPQDVTKDDRTRAILKKSPAAAAAQRGIQEKSILGGSAAQTAAVPSSGETGLSNKEGREMKGYLKKWTNYTSGYKLRWFVLEDGVLSYYKHQDDAGSACRGAINMKIARLHMDPQDKLRFEIHGKSSVKYHLKANHQVEAKRWYWALNNAIQWSKDEAKDEERRQTKETEAFQSAKLEQFERKQQSSLRVGGSVVSLDHYPKSFQSNASLAVKNGPSDDNDASQSGYDTDRNEMSRYNSQPGTTAYDGDDNTVDEHIGEDTSSHDHQPTEKNAITITAQSTRLQLDLLAQVTAAIQAQQRRNPSTTLADPGVDQALATFDSAIGNLKGLVGDLLRISRDRDSYWTYRLDREQHMRHMWEESMTLVARESEALQNKYSESEEKRKITKKALRDALGGMPERSEKDESMNSSTEPGMAGKRDSGIKDRGEMDLTRRATLANLADDSDSGSEADVEFFDAVDAGEVEVVDMPPNSAANSPKLEMEQDTIDERLESSTQIEKSFRGYEQPPRERLTMDADNRPKISLWGILKSMIGKDMTKMTLPVSFNEPTSLLQRVAEDMEYTDLLDTAADRIDSSERMVYVAAFAASEYASTIGRVAKPFNPLLGETFEYARPDKGYRFFIEQVSHHPPIGAAWAESSKWTYYGESAVKSKFYGKSFDINPLGTWFLRLHPSSGGPPELYTWKKVTSSVVGIITGSPVVDNYGPMEVKNWTTGETCVLDFKPRGWKASSAHQVTGRVLSRDGQSVTWTIGGKWNDRIFARQGVNSTDQLHSGAGQPLNSPSATSSHQAILVWECSPRPKKPLPFNLTPFVVTLNALNDQLRPLLAPTDTRLRPDQRAMEDGEYDLAATEKNRVEEKQRAARRVRDGKGEEFVPRWFGKSTCETTGEEYWNFSGEYWRMRDVVAEGKGGWEGCEDIF